MSYTDKIECPHCGGKFEVEVKIETEFGEHTDAYAVIEPLPLNHHSQAEEIEYHNFTTDCPTKRMIDCPNNGETYWDRLELERRLGK